MATRISTVELQVMWNRLIAVVDEQAQALMHTAFSPIVRESGDISANDVKSAEPVGTICTCHRRQRQYWCWHREDTGSGRCRSHRALPKWQNPG